MRLCCLLLLFGFVFDGCRVLIFTCKEWTLLIGSIYDLVVNVKFVDFKGLEFHNLSLDRLLVAVAQPLGHSSRIDIHVLLIID